MANTYTQLYVHLIFAVKNRNSLIQKIWKDDMEKYITGIVQNHKHKLLAIGTMPNHIYISALLIKYITLIRTFLKTNVLPFCNHYKHYKVSLKIEKKSNSARRIKAIHPAQILFPLESFLFFWQMAIFLLSHNQGLGNSISKCVSSQQNLKMPVSQKLLPDAVILITNRLSKLQRFKI